MKITTLTKILFAVLTLVLVLALFGCQNGNGGEDGTNEIETSVQDACKHESTDVNSRCEEYCTTCGKIISVDNHGETTVNFKCEEICVRCGKVSRTDVHGESIINDDCEKVCLTCGKVYETEVHGEKVINDKCEEVCERCGKVYQTGIHDEGAYGENCDKSCTRCGTTLATGEHGDKVINDKCEEVCVRCGKVYATGVHAEKIVNDQLQEVCSRCGEVYVECVHDEGVIENCVKSCGKCGEIIDAEAHGEKVVNDNCDEVCADCGKIYATDVHAEGVVGDDCVKYCSRCNDVMETEVHADKIINDACEEVCSRCGKVYNTDMHEAGVETYVDDYFTNVRTYTKACARCGGNVEYSYTIQLGAKKPEVFVNAAQLAAIGMGNKFEKTVLSADGTYATFKSVAGQGGDANFYPFVGDGSVSGQFIIIKYRTTLAAKWELWASAGTDKTGAAGGENFLYTPVANGEWQYLVVDLAKTKSSTFKAEDGKYCIDFFRWDIFNSSTANSETVDVAYVAIADSLNELTATCTDAETVQVVVGSENKYYEIYTEGGTPAGSGTNVPGVAKPFFICNMDNACNSADGKIQGKNGMATVSKKLTTLANGRFTVFGWAGAYADIVKYQYSIDGGATWREFIGGDTTSNEAGVVAAIKNAAPNLFDSGVTSIPNCRFRNLAADLSDCYGQTVSFIFAALLENGDRLSMVKYSEVEVTSCSHAIVADEDWVDHETNPQLEAANCSWCKEFTYRMKTKTPQGLVLYNPEMLLACTSNGGYTGSIKTTESGMKYFSAVSSKDASEGNLTIVDGNNKLSNIGRYAFAIVRKNVGEASIQMYHRAPNASGTPNTQLVVTLGEDFQLLIFDMGNHAASGELGWVRFDLINGTKSVAGRDIADVAAIGFANNKEDAYSLFGKYVNAFDLKCNHIPDNSWTATENEGEIAMTCVVCKQLCNAMACTHADTTKLSNVTLKATASATVYYTADCALCGGVQVDVPSLTQEGNRVLTAAELNALAYAQAGLVKENPERYGYQLVTNDGLPYVRFTSKGTAECKLFLNDGTSAFTGVNDYVAILYRCTGTAGKTFDFFYNTAGVTNTTGVKSNTSTALAVDGTWQLAIIKANQIASGKTDGYGWTRLDVLNGTTIAAGDVIDIAYVGFFSSEAESINYYKGYLEFVDCAHPPIAVPSFVWDTANKYYTSTCALCDKVLTKDMLYKTEASPNGGGAMKSFTAKQENGFVRYTATGSADPYIHIYRSGNVVTGQYAVIKYRVVNQNADCTVGSFFAGTVVTNYNGAQGKYGDNSIIKQADKFFGDGEWHYLVVTPNLATNTAFAANEDGTYSWQYLRIGVGGMKAYDNSCYIDIDEIAFADNAEAAEYYAYKNDPKPVFTNNIDYVHLDGTATGDKGGGGNDKPKVVNLSGKTITNAATSIKLQGWCVTPGGVASYKLRVTSIDGKAVENPALVDWATATTLIATDAVTKQGTNRGFSTNCRFGARYYDTAVNLSAWSGKTINFEIVAVTNYGAEITIIQINNVTLP